MAAMNGKGPGDKITKVAKKVAKAADKAVKRIDSGKDASKAVNRMSKAGASASDFVSAIAKSTATKGQTKAAMNYLKGKTKK
jgi:hypothetical protein